MQMCTVIVLMRAKVSTPAVIAIVPVKQCSMRNMIRSMDMTPEARHKLRQLLTKHEKYVQFPYADITGHLTIGIGRNLAERGISTTEAGYLLDDDIQYFYGKLDHFLRFFVKMDENRQVALVDMCFNLGIQ